MPSSSLQAQTHAVFSPCRDPFPAPVPDSFPEHLAAAVVGVSISNLLPDDLDDLVARPSEMKNCNKIELQGVFWLVKKLKYVHDCNAY